MENTEKRKVKETIGKFWGDLFCVSGKAKYGTRKEFVDWGTKI